MELLSSVVKNVNVEEEAMRFLKSLAVTALAAPLVASVAWADMEAQQGSGKAGGWAPRVAVLSRVGTNSR